MKKYQEIVMIQDSCGVEQCDRLKEAKGYDALFSVLEQWDYGDGEIYNEPPWGSADRLRYKDDLVLSYQNGLYYSLTRVVEE